MSVILVCRICSAPLGDDPQERTTGFCSGKCAKAHAVTNPRCEKRFLGSGAVCALNAGHSGVHQATHGFTWIDERPVANATHAMWNELIIRQQENVRNFPNGPASSSLGRAVDALEKAVQGYADMTKKVDSDIANEMLGRSVPSPTRKTCACCPNPVNINNPHAVFCSGGCAEKAANVYKAKTGPTITGSFTFGRAEIATAADRMLRFMCGLNLQDHPVKEQREALEIIHAMQAALKPEKSAFEGTLGRLRDGEARQKLVRAENARSKAAR